MKSLWRKSASIRSGAAAILAAAAMISADAMAHSAWLEVRGDKAVLVDGHPDDPSDNRMYDAFRMVHGAAYDKSMNAMSVKVEHDGETKFDLKGKPALLTAHFNNGFWSKSESEGWLRKPGSQVPDAIDSMYSHKYAKLYMAPVSQPDKVLGHPLEIVPLTDPSKVKPGEVLKVRVTLFGEPLANAEVIGDVHVGHDASDSVTVLTDEAGIASIEVASRPFVIIEAKRSVGLSADPHVKSLFLAATIGFHPAR